MRALLWLLLIVPVIAGCGAAATPLPTPHAASPQRVDLDWVERFGDATGGLVYGVQSFEVTKAGWQAHVSIANQTPVPFTVGDTQAAGEHAFGVMLFATHDHRELDQRNASNSLPAIRPATEFVPPLPHRLAAGQTWAGTISARGPLVAATWVRIVFGPLFGPKNEPKLPAALRDAHPDQGLVWITDHAYGLKR